MTEEDNVKKMLRAIINGQSVMKSELLGEIQRVDTKLNKEIGGLKGEMKKGFVQLNKRIDKIGSQLAYLEDDAPTREEFDNLDVRVSNIERGNAS